VHRAITNYEIPPWNIKYSSRPTGPPEGLPPHAFGSEALAQLFGQLQLEAEPGGGGGAGMIVGTDGVMPVVGFSELRYPQLEGPSTHPGGARGTTSATARMAYGESFFWALQRCMGLHYRIRGVDCLSEEEKAVLLRGQLRYVVAKRMYKDALNKGASFASEAVERLGHFLSPRWTLPSETTISEVLECISRIAELEYVECLHEVVHRTLGFQVLERARPVGGQHVLVSADLYYPFAAVVWSTSSHFFPCHRAPTAVALPLVPSRGVCTRFIVTSMDRHKFPSLRKSRLEGGLCSSGSLIPLTGA
jgi:hypothetical protein